MTRTLQRAAKGQALPGENYLASNRFFDHQFACDVIKIKPGEFFVGTGNIALATVLGSCVSACLWDPVTRLGGMNHFMLAEAKGRADHMRYGQFAMDTLLQHLLAAGALAQSIEAKVFGGARILRGLNHSEVGRHNVQFVQEYLHAQNIPITAQDLGSYHPRKLYFFPETGQVKLRRLPADESSTVILEEQAYQHRIIQEI